MQAKPTRRAHYIAAIAALACAAAITASAQTHKRPIRQDWPVYGASSSGDRYSPLTQLNRANVHQLKEAWRFDPGEPGGLQTNPLIVGRVLFGFTPTQKVIALDAATGKKLWTFDTGTPGLQPTRGLTYWTDGTHSILFAGLLSYLYALDPATGRPIPTFGDSGRIDLRKDLDEPNITQSFAAMTSPGVIFRDTIIVGFRAPESKPALRGDIRSYDVHTGKLRWIFHTVPRPGEPGYDTWPPDAWKYTGAANNWTGMALDEARGIVYVPTGSAVDDFYGADRLGNDRFANTLLALDAATGKRLWDFQGVHHDIWDRDFPSPPTLVTVRSNGHKVDAVAQSTKQGFLYLFDRATGKPALPHRRTSLPTLHRPRRESLAHAARSRRAGALRPPAPHPGPPHHPHPGRPRRRGQAVRRPSAAKASSSLSASTSRPSSFPASTAARSGAAPPWTSRPASSTSTPTTSPGPAASQKASSAAVWAQMSTKANAPSATPATAAAHRQPSHPSIDVDKRLTDAQITAIIQNGRGRMPSFPNVEHARLTAILEYLKTGKEAPAATHTPAASPNRQELAGAKLYSKNCALCHADDLLGAPSNYPGLVGVRGRLSDAQILANIHNGKGRMPAFKLTEAESASLLHFLGASESPMVEAAVTAGASSKQEVESSMAPPGGAAKYRFTGYRKFLDPDGYPAVTPPWGTLNAVDLNTGKYLWKIPLGNYPELAAQGLADTGSENYGGPVVTAGGLVFIAATIYDHRIRAFDSHTGALLWSADLPFAGNATPATYMVDGKQYLVIATSNARNLKGPQGAAYVAFALP